MSRPLRALVLLILVSACGSANHTAPRNLNDACAIVDQRPSYLAAFKRTEQKWGLPVSVQMATMYQESRFVGNARTPRQYALGVIPLGRQSSAYGYSQALDGTWDDYRRDQGRRRAKRDNIRDASDFMGWYMHGSQQQLGIPLTDARNQYLAYHEGRTGFRRGSFNRKSWLLRVSSEVASRATLYENQLRSCRKI